MCSGRVDPGACGYFGNVFGLVRLVMSMCSGRVDPGACGYFGNVCGHVRLVM